MLLTSRLTRSLAGRLVLIDLKRYFPSLDESGETHGMY